MLKEINKVPNSSLRRMGNELRRLRKSRHETLADVAKRAEVSIGFLSQTERGISNPSMRHLQKIAEALGVPLGHFFDSGDKEGGSEDSVVVRRSQRKALHFGHLGFIDYLLSPRQGEGLELLLSELMPGATSGQPYNHEGEEAGIVLSGQLDIWVGNNRYFLTEGDSFGFSSKLEHSYTNPGDTTTLVVWAITPPGL